MKTLKETAPGAIVTVRRVAGNREFISKMERMRIMAGSDLTVLRAGEDGLWIHNGFGEERLSLEEAEKIRVGAQFKRNNDPILLSGCCASGNTCDIFDRIEAMYKERETHE